MAYNFSKGKRGLGDITFEDDADTGIDFEADTVKIETGGVERVTVTNTGLGIGGAPSCELHVKGDDARIRIDGDTDSHPGLELSENGTRKWIVYNDYTNDNLTFKTNSNTRMSIEQDGDVGIGTTSPIAKLDVAGKIAITAESSTPSQPSDGQGYLYTKTDGKIYWRSYDVAETDLTAVGEGGGTPATLVLMAHVSSDFNVTTTSQNEYLTVPFDSVLKTTFAGSDFNTSTHTFTAPEEGYYFINCSLFHNSISATPTQYQIRISSSADWGYGGAIAFRNFFPGAMAETTTHTHRLDRIAHLSGSDEVKITIRPVAGAGSYGKIVGLPHVSYLTIHKL